MLRLSGRASPATSRILQRQQGGLFSAVSRLVRPDSSPAHYARCLATRRGRPPSTAAPSTEKEPKEVTELPDTAASIDAAIAKPKRKPRLSANKSSKVPELARQDEDTALVNSAQASEELPIVETDKASTVPTAMPHTMLIDGSFLTHRAYHAPFPAGMTNGDGVAVNAVFSYTRSMLKMLNDPALRPDYIAVFVDSGPSFRKQLHSEYKAHRSAPSEELKQQFPLIADATRALGIEIIKAGGMEADDLIACYTKVAQSLGHRVTIISRDKDLMQLVGPTVKLYDPIGKMTIDEGEVRRKFSVEPKQVRDLLALMGDDGDNVPGVLGIGPKTAASLVTEFKSIEELLANIDNIQNKKRRQLIKENVEVIRKALSLVELRYDVPLPLDFNQLQRKPIDRQQFLSFLEQHSFKSIIKKIDTICPPSASQLAAEAQHAVRTTTSRGRPRLDSPTLETMEGPPPPASVAIGSKRPPVKVDGVTIVDNPDEARRVLRILMSPGVRERYHACDTEAIGIEVKSQSPYNYGEVICASVYCGPDVDFGSGPNLWIDNMDDAKGVLELFKEYFENEEIKKVWHNYSFDRAMLWRHGIDVKGFGGDTIHMARLWDAARTSVGKKYSLEALTAELLEGQHKRSIKEIFGRNKVKKDGSLGKEIVVPELDALQRGEAGMEALMNWIFYSTFDTRGTFELRDKLESELREMPWSYEGKKSLPGVNQTMWDYYQNYWLPFGELLTDIEREGIKVDVDYLAHIETVATKQASEHQKHFKEWASEYCQDAIHMNPTSDAQKQQLFFAPCKNSKSDEMLPAERYFDIENEEGIPDPVTGKVKKKRQIRISGLGLTPVAYTVSGWPAASAEVLKQLAGRPTDNPPKYGTAFKAFGEGEAGAEACKAIDSLVKMSSIDTLLHNFIVPLQHEVDQNNRIHASLNLNTETGRLSCRRPNLQNQPALEKDIFKIRSAFTCEKGKKLIVADYGQLELRLLAHMTKCRSMIDAFQKGGDFHSRTALGMYSHVQEAIKKGEVLLEWGGEGKPPVPLLKDIYATERKRAKTLNFSIAYGKTEMGLSKDWGVSLQEAKDTLSRWYADRPEVLAWQQETIRMAKKTGYTKTLMGRYRPLADINHPKQMMRGHAERAAINTPIQGGAADIVINAMVLAHHDEILRRWGWKMILQVHDELMLEGPEESAEEALARLIEIMRHPMPEGEELLVDLAVDGKVGSTWYEAK